MGLNLDLGPSNLWDENYSQVCWKMKKWIGIFILLCGETFGRISHHTRRNEEEDDRISVIVGMKTDDRARLVSRIAERIIRPGKLFKRISAMSIEVTRSELESLRQDPDVLYVEEDGMVYPDAEAVDYGQTMIQAQSDVFNAAKLIVPSSAACNNPASFKVGVRIVPI
jgi:Peptidase inhibitor I9